MSIIIDVAAEFTGKKAFNQAETATDKLNKGVSNLAKGVIAAFSVTKVLAFSKASINAAAQDQKAQQQLALALKNVGLGRDAATAEGYIQRLQSEFGIVDDKLRPAYQVLAIATRDTAEAQRLMGIAMDISAANSLDLGAVSKALSKAFLGNNTSLSKLGVGISKADLKTKSFKEITNQLSLTFAGAASTAASGYQGSLDKLAIAAENVKEKIGVGLLDALQIVSGDQGMGNATSAAEKYAQKVSDATVGTAYLIAELKKIPGASYALKLLSDPLGINTLLNAAQAFKQEPRPFKTPMSISGQVEKTTSTSVQNKVAKETLKISKDSLKLAKAKAIFDLQKIQIEAALKGKISEEDKIRLKLMQAIEDENITLVEKYSKLLDIAQAKTKALQDLLNGVKGTALPNPFETWDLRPIKTQLDELDKYLMAFNGNMASAFATLTASQQALLGGYVPFVGATNASIANAAAFLAAQNSAAAGNTSNANTNINVTVNGAVDPVSTATQINNILNDAAAQQGGFLGYGLGYKTTSYAV